MDLSTSSNNQNAQWLDKLDDIGISSIDELKQHYRTAPSSAYHTDEYHLLQLVVNDNSVDSIIDDNPNYYCAA